MASSYAAIIRYATSILPSLVLENHSRRVVASKNETVRHLKEDSGLDRSNQIDTIHTNTLIIGHLS